MELNYKIAGFILRLSEEAEEPRMALIVDIAERMNSQIAFIVSAARKILLRERKMVEVFEKNPAEVLRMAVINMLPKNKLRAQMIKRLTIND